MKTHFHIENKDFTEYLKITANEKEYYFCDDLTIEYADCDALNVDIEFVRAEEHPELKEKNIFFRLLINIVKWILSPLLYFVDNEDGIRLDKGYHYFNPFEIKQSISIASPDEKIVNITYIESKYNKATKKYTPPTIEFQEDIVIKTAQVTFSPRTLKREWNTYHIPVFTIILVIIALLNWLNFSIFAKVIREIPLYPMSENIGGIIGMSFCSLVMVALLVAVLVMMVKAHRLYKEVKQINL